MNGCYVSVTLFQQSRLYITIPPLCVPPLTISIFVSLSLIFVSIRSFCIHLFSNSFKWLANKCICAIAVVVIVVSCFHCVIVWNETKNGWGCHLLEIVWLNFKFSIGICCPKSKKKYSYAIRFDTKILFKFGFSVEFISIYSNGNQNTWSILLVKYMHINEQVLAVLNSTWSAYYDVQNQNAMKANQTMNRQNLIV